MVSPTINSCRHSTCSPEDKNNISNTNTGGKKTLDNSFYLNKSGTSFYRLELN
jgi:hypothetical protein